MSRFSRLILPGFNIDAQKAPRIHLPERSPGSHKMRSGSRKTKMRSGVLQHEFPEFMSIDRTVFDPRSMSTLGSHLPVGARMLDLCCGNGVAAWGYWLSGRFSEIVGIDLYEQPAYPFTFIQGDAFTLDYEFLAQFDFIHASPPCQGYSKMTPPEYKRNHPLLIPAAHLMLQASGKPYVIENVEGSGHHLRPNLVIDGGGVGLPMKRVRYFHVSTLKRPIKMVSSSSSAQYIPNGGHMRLSELKECFGLEDFPAPLTRNGIKQGIAPAMTRWIAETLFTNDKAV